MRPFTLSGIAKALLLSLCLASATNKTSAQADNLCIFKESTAAYVPLGDEVDVTSIVFTPDSFYTLTALLGDTYPLLGQPWLIDTVHAALFIMSNGRMYLGLDTGFAIFDCMYSDSIDLIDASSKVSYWISGTGNQEILKVQWKNLRIRPGPAGNFFNVQMWLYKETGVIEFRYGPRSANNASGYTTAGPTGIYTGIWYSNNNFTTMYEKIQVKGLPPNIQIDSNLNTNVPNIHGMPDSGTVYRFVPKAVAASVPLAKSSAAIRIIPNPATDRITVLLPGNEKASVSIVNATGSVVYSSEVSNTSSLDITTANLPAGQYYVRFIGSSGEQVQPLTIIK